EKPAAAGVVVDRAVLAERRARRAEAAEQEQARRAAAALQTVAALERRLEEVRPPSEGLGAALASAADLRLRAGAWHRERLAAEAALAATLEEAARAGHTLQARIAELERQAAADPDRLDRLAREQAEAAASRATPARSDLAERLDAAAAALRDRTPVPTAD